MRRLIFIFILFTVFLYSFTNISYKKQNISNKKDTICQPFLARIDSTFPSYLLNQICDGDSITFYGSGNYRANNMYYHQSDSSSHFFWSFGDDTTASGQIVKHKYTAYGTYNIKLVITDTMGCKDSVYKKIRIQIPPQAIIRKTYPYCLEDKVILSALIKPGYKYQWKLNGNDITGATDSIYTFTAKDSGNFEYRVNVVNYCGTKLSLPETVVINTLPKGSVIKAEDIDTICDGDSIQLKAITSTDNEIKWQINGKDTTGYTYETIFAKKNGKYGISMTNKITTCTNTAEIQINTKSCELKFYNVFTPDGNGKNDKFEIENVTQFDNCHLIVFNRWGRVVFEKIGYKNDWNMQGCSDGVYFYVLKIPGRKEHHGSFTIIGSNN